MIPEKEKAAVLPAAINNKRQIESYHQRFGESKEIFTELIGFLLLRLVAGQAEPLDWRMFDQLLRQLYAGDTL